MERKDINKLAALTLSGLVLAGCGGLGKMAKHMEELNLTVTPNPVEMHGDSVKIEFTGKFPPKYFHKKVVAEATPVLVSSTGEEKAFKTEIFQGESAAGNGTVIPYANGKSFTYTDVIPYSPDMEVAELKVKIHGTQGSKTKDFDPVKVADGTKTTPLLVMSDDKVLIGADKFQRTTSHEQNAVIHYLVNSSAVRSGELRDADMKEMVEFIKGAKENPKIQIKSSDVQGYASPEGEISLNENLANERAASANLAIGNILKKQKHEASDRNDLYKNIAKGEDWAGFKQKMEASDIQDKELIIRVLEMYSDVTKREQEIKNLSKTYEIIAEDILPQLRRSQIAVKYDLVGKSDEEITALAKSNPDSLNVEELLFAATLTNDMNEQMNIYKAAERIYPNDWRGPNNVGYIHFMQNKLNDAATQFEKANGIQKNDVSTNNMAVCTRLRGDRVKAKSMLESATGAGKEVNYNLGIINIQDGHYADAVSNLGMMGEKTFNLGLAKLLNGDGAGASEAVDGAADKDSALASYLRAVIAARGGDEAGVTNNLKAAFGKDGSLKDKAMKDAEFLKWKDQIGGM